MTTRSHFAVLCTGKRERVPRHPSARRLIGGHSLPGGRRSAAWCDSFPCASPWGASLPVIDGGVDTLGWRVGRGIDRLVYLTV